MKILVTGIRGQVGQVFLNAFGDDFEIVGLSREEGNFKNIEIMNWPSDKKSFKNLLEDLDITHIVHLAGQSSVSFSFNSPKETYESNVILTNKIINAIENSKTKPYLYVALSSEMYGASSRLPITSKTPVNPISPYGFSKAIVKYNIDYHRMYNNLKIGGGITFNHESEFRDNRFFLKSLIHQSINVKKGIQEKVILGNLSVARDFSDAYDVCSAIKKFLELKYNGNLVICSGKAISLKKIQEYVFNRLHLNSCDLINSSELFRENEIMCNYGDISEMKEILKWEPKSDIYSVIERIIERAL